MSARASIDAAVSHGLAKVSPMLNVIGSANLEIASPLTACSIRSAIRSASSQEVCECMVRRMNAREKFRMKESLRQCIRPLGGEFSPGLDEIRRVPVL